MQKQITLSDSSSRRLWSVIGARLGSVNISENIFILNNEGIANVPSSKGNIRHFLGSERALAKDSHSPYETGPYVDYPSVQRNHGGEATREHILEYERVADSHVKRRSCAGVSHHRFDPQYRALLWGLIHARGFYDDVWSNLLPEGSDGGFQRRCGSFSSTLGSLSLSASGDSQIVCIDPAIFHFSQLTAHSAPLEYADYNRAQSEERNSSGKADHGTFRSANALLNVLYLALHVLIGYGLCWLACQRIWQWTGLFDWTFLGGLLLYLLSGVVIWHGFIVAQKLMDNA